MRTKLITLVVGGAVGLAVVPVPAEAAPWVAAICGAVLTSSDYLPADLTCPGNGVSFDLSGPGGPWKKTVFLDLRGHHLRGGSTSTGAAVSVAGAGTLSVRDGTIEGWDVGVQTVPGDPGEGLDVKKLTVEGVTFRNNGMAVDSSGFPHSSANPHVVVNRSLFVSNATAIEGRDGGPIQVDRSTFRGNGDAFWLDSSSLSVSRSRLEDNQTAASCRETSCDFTGNTFHHNGLAILLGLFTEGTLTGNVFSDNNSGYQQTTFATGRLSHNQFTGNQTAVSMTDSTGLLEENTFVKNGAAFVLEDVGFVLPDTSLRRNVFIQNRDGVYAPDGGATLTANTAVANTGWGIFAPGSIDGGGNVAYGNGLSPQCEGVTCP